MSEEVYYLSSLESERLSPVRMCTVLFRTKFVSGKECIVANVSPVILAQDFGVPELSTVVLAARHEGEGLVSIVRFPCFVFVCRVIAAATPGPGTAIERADVEIVGRGELYRTAHDAQHHVFDPTV